MSTGTVGSITGFGTTPYGPHHGVTKYPKAFGVPDGGSNRQKIPGSVCSWIDKPVPSDGLTNTASLLVGYGVSRAGWKNLVAYYRAGAPETGYPHGFSDTPTYTPLHLGHRSQAFLITADLANYYGYTPSEFPSGHLYAVTVLTARRNLLQVWFANVNATTTETWVEHILKNDAGFF